ncbi:MAG: peptidyl-tRNA hydrolase [Candidatus Aenigmarchaeota archaeon]|nr:peptidyl-tRNA hydrolase [Candidatus Aenigmarchaeota archaeon]
MKQALVVRSDVKMSRGKLAVQCSHASYSAASAAKRPALQQWAKDGQKKVVLKAKDIALLMQLRDACIRLRLPHALISDAGMTELSPGTITCLGIGPADEAAVNKVTGSLPLLK